MVPDKNGEKLARRPSFSSVLSALLRKRLIILRGPKERRRVVFSACLLYCIGAFLLAPHLVLLSALLAFFLHYRFFLREDREGATPEEVQQFFSRTADSARRAGDALYNRFSAEGPTRTGEGDFERDYEEDG